MSFCLQERFLFPSTVKDNVSSWWIPISISTAARNSDFTETRPKLWLAQGQRSIAAEIDAENDEWVLANVQRTGVNFTIG